MALDPLTISPSWWLDASDATTIDLVDVSGVATVSQWRDKSGNGKHCYTATASKRPKYLAADPLANGKPSVSARDATSVLVTQDMATAALQVQIAEIYFVLGAMTGVETIWSTANMWGTAGSADGYGGLIGAVGTQQRMLGNVNAAVFNPGFALATTMRQNGSTSARSAILPMPFSVQRVVVSATVSSLQRVLLNETTTAVRAWKGPICEVLAFPTTLSAANATAVNQYLMDKWLTAAGISGSAVAPEADDSTAASGRLPIQGTAATIEANDSATGSGRLAIAGTLITSEQDDLLGAAGRLCIVGSFIGIDGDETVSAGGSLQIAGWAELIDDDDQGEAQGALRISGRADLAEGDDTLAASGGEPVAAVFLRPPPARVVRIIAQNRVASVSTQRRRVTVSPQQRVVTC